MSDKAITLTAIIAAANNGQITEQDPWINGAFRVVVKRGYPKEGKKPSKASIFDPDTGQEAKLACFSLNLANYDGKIVEISGKGNKAELYEGKVEITVGKNGTLAQVGDYSGGGSTAPRSDAPQGGGDRKKDDPPPPAAKPKVDPTTYFHREMSRQSLAYLHCLQYVTDVRAKAKKDLKLVMPEDQFQAAVSSLYIQGNKDGLFALVPKLREIDAEGLPLRYLPPQPDPAEEERRRVAKEEADRIAREAEEARRRLATSHASQENLDEDVPF